MILIFSQVSIFLAMLTFSCLLTNAFVAENLSLPYVGAYLDSIGSNFRHGANFATGGSTIQHVDTKIFGAGFSPISLEIQLLQFKQFKARTDELFQRRSGKVFGDDKNYGVKHRNLKLVVLSVALLQLQVLTSRQVSRGQKTFRRPYTV